VTNELSLLDQIVAFADRRGITLPVFSNAATRLRAAAASGTYNIEELERSIATDQALTVEVLRMANSAFYGGLVEISTVRAALVRLGMDQVVRLSVLAAERSKYTARDRQLAGLMRELWQHASACALASEWIARKLRYTALMEQVFIGGLLHDIGKAFVVRVLDELMADQASGTKVSIELVREVMRTAHTSQGHRLLCSWNLPQVYQTIVRDHHVEPLDETNIPLSIVRLANCACNKMGIGSDVDESIVLASTAEAQALNVSEVILAELEIMLEDIQSEAKAA
jgi:putative nucleotidyltransferase with HDIG domain